MTERETEWCYVHGKAVNYCPYPGHAAAPAQASGREGAASDEYWCDTCEKPAQYECLTCYGQRCVECVKGHTCTEGRPLPAPAPQRQEEDEPRATLSPYDVGPFAEDEPPEYEALTEARKRGEKQMFVPTGHLPGCKHSGGFSRCACRRPQRQEEAQRPMVTRAFFDARVAELEAEIQDEEHSRELHASLNRRAAEALGKPPFGEGSSWHDIPEQITALRAALSASEAEHLRVLDDLFYKHTAAMQAAQKAIEAAEAQATTLREALESDAAGQSAAETLRAAADYLLQAGGGPLEYRLRLLAQNIESALEPLPEGASQDKERGAK